MSNNNKDKTGKTQGTLLSNISRIQPVPPDIPLPNNLSERQKELIRNGWPVQAFDFPVEVFPGIWLSGVGFDDDLPSWCYKSGFTHIVNAAGKYGCFYYKTDPNVHDIKYLELNIEDLPDISLQPFLFEMYTFVSVAYQNQGKILIHCIWGQSRSVSCLIYFAMLYWGMKYDTVIKIIRDVRPSANPNKGFEYQLRMIDIAKNLLNK